MDLLWAPWRTRYIQAVADRSPDSCFLCEALTAPSPEAAYVVHTTSLSFVILNIYPYNTGHTMVVPRRHTGDLTQLSEEELLDLSLLVQRTVRALKKAYAPHGFNIGINLGRPAGAGLESHLHYHIVPRWNGDTNFMPVIADTKVISQALDETYRLLRDAFSDES